MTITIMSEGKGGRGVGWGGGGGGGHGGGERRIVHMIPPFQSVKKIS